MIFKIDVGHDAKNAAYVFRCLCQPLRIAAWCSAISHTAPRWLALLEPCREVSQRAAALHEHPRSLAPRTVTLKHLLEFWETFIVLFVGDSTTLNLHADLQRVYLKNFSDCPNVQATLVLTGACPNKSSSEIAACSFHCYF